MPKSVTISTSRYQKLKQKAELFDQFIETEKLSKREMMKIKEALKGPFLNEEEFQKKHPHPGWRTK
ncbi:MAG TPA: hypothetical protein VJB90_04925 [Candidatus Nanoarchaeia archaeon]|nr:hypothetical protein [Candidatus Nanoarchaeia archaeon]